VGGCRRRLGGGGGGRVLGVGLLTFFWSGGFEELVVRETVR